MTRGRILCPGVCRVWNSYVRSVEIDFGDTAILSFYPSRRIEMLHALRERCRPPTRKSVPAPFTIATAVGAVNSKIGNQGLSFNLYVCVWKREYRGNRHGKMGRLRFSFSSGEQFLCKAKMKKEFYHIFLWLHNSLVNFLKIKPKMSQRKRERKKNVIILYMYISK